ncbi:NAD(P)-binding protein [Daedalea quercina L-15889]|uniref:NAD(P)-binding protein n=1 Tax=Daedalea quercina L-15889 TaxID=1314783 RepID=A0A165R775_9APHY|nr:NAD(P)-binding protein [Daedalea quercina L-15889]
MVSPPTRVAIVTGAAQGIGLSIALRLADDGLAVAVNDIVPKASKVEEVASQIRAKGRRSLAVTGDVSNEDDVKAMIAKVVEELGSIDVMIANAGIALRKPFIETTTEEWERIVSINLRGVMLCYRYAAVEMVKQGRGGRIIGTTNLSAYSATKFAVRGLTQTVGEHDRALELAPHKITVNAYAPGFIMTDLAYHPDDSKNGGKPGSTIKKLFGLPLDSPEAGPETVASMVSYLASPESHFMTGPSGN